MEQFKVTLWNDGNTGWGIRVGHRYALKYFPMEKPIVHVNLDGNWIEINLNRYGRGTFWGTCPEFRNVAIRHWTENNGITKENKTSVTGTMTKIGDGQWKLNLGVRGRLGT